MTPGPPPEPNDAPDPATGEPAIDPRLLEVLVCPVSRGPLVYDRAANELVSRNARLAYPIRNGVPILLRDEARDLDAPE